MTKTTEFARSYYRNAVRSVASIEAHLEYALYDWRNSTGRARAGLREIAKIKLGSLRSARKHEAWVSKWMDNEAASDRIGILIEASKTKTPPLDLAMNSLLQAPERRMAA